MTRSELVKRAADRTMYHLRPDRNTKLAMAARSRSPHSEELVDQVRNAEGSYQQIADRMGLNKAFVGDIRSGSHRKPATPFTGLGARLAANDSNERKRA